MLRTPTLERYEDQYLIDFFSFFEFIVKFH